ncbi:hypothetical protein Pcaca04_25250 [Pectobacterium carotovorum subsp. carotovorum]|nr:hypothetical protein Pcaca04_25250 [Pectobacterium carotovorum subsp. carotovorum]
MQTSDLIAVGALAASVLSLMVSIKGYYVSKKSLKLSAIDHQDKYRDVIGYLIRGFKWTNNKDTYATFAISYTNNSSNPNSFKDIILEVEYYDENRVFNKAKLLPSTIVLPSNLRESHDELKVPIYLSPKETKSGWITFQIPKIGGKKINIDIYRVIAISTAEKTTIIESYILTFVGTDEK